MTLALCLNCGEVKFGAICPCPKCEVESTGDMQLDIAFSDHHMGKDSLYELGAAIAAIHEESSDDELCFWTFIHYVSINHPSLLGVDLKPELKATCEDLLQRVALPEVTLRPSLKEELRAQRAKSGKRWWQFWKRGGNGEETLN